MPKEGSEPDLISLAELKELSNAINEATTTTAKDTLYLKHFHAFYDLLSYDKAADLYQEDSERIDMICRCLSYLTSAGSPLVYLSAKQTAHLYRTFIKFLLEAEPYQDIAFVQNLYRICANFCFAHVDCGRELFYDVFSSVQRLLKRATLVYTDNNYLHRLVLKVLHNITTMELEETRNGVFELVKPFVLPILSMYHDKTIIHELNTILYNSSLLANGEVLQCHPGRSKVIFDFLEPLLECVDQYFTGNNLSQITYFLGHLGSIAAISSEYSYIVVGLLSVAPFGEYIIPNA
ncbi:hypothetical protein ADUPG1_000576 [Aduncisulcus paluster]|uniref:Protein SDA1 n=1 Tax=Aduncisulcus paluster TaxID=2918883 RepID=A0ABQ5K8P8_9EUKA|nr:hypothetical protein ADUPG1_000576 [Aduncisulcus paluster]